MDPWGVNGRLIWLSVVALFGSLGADDEDLSGGVDDVGGDGLQLVDAHEAGDLGHQPFDEAEVAAGDLLDGVDRFGVVGVAGVEWLAELVLETCEIPIDKVLSMPLLLGLS